MMTKGRFLVTLFAVWGFLATACSSGGASAGKSREEFEAGVAKVLGVDLDKISESEVKCLQSLGLSGEFKKDSEHAMAVGNQLHGIHVVTKTHDRLITYRFYEDREGAGPGWGFKLFFSYRDDGSFSRVSGMRLIYPGKDSAN